jgi:hypothetical protein
MVGGEAAQASVANTIAGRRLKRLKTRGGGAMVEARFYPWREGARKCFGPLAAAREKVQIFFVYSCLQRRSGC